MTSIQTQYLQPDSPLPMMKKSPLAMLVETCSSIGQDSNRLTPLKRKMSGSESAKAKSASPRSTEFGTRADVPSPPNARHSLERDSISTHCCDPPPNPQYQSVTMATLAAQYHLMYQHLLYQAEMEQMKAKERLAQQQKASEISPRKTACTICRLSPNYCGRCPHEDSVMSPLSHKLEMAKLSQLGYPIIPPFDPMAYPLALGEPRKLSDDALKLSPSYSYKLAEYNQLKSNLDQRLYREHRLKLEGERARLIAESRAVKECHWVDGDGYCGRKFYTQEALLDHLKSHVTTENPKGKLCQDMPISSGTELYKSGSRYQPYSIEKAGVMR